MCHALELVDVCKSYEHFSLQKVSFTVSKGSITGLVGPNGSGKTTTIKAIENIINTDSGTIRMFESPKTISENNKIGTVMDMPYYPGHWTSKDIERSLAAFYEQWDKQSYAKCLRLFEIDKKKTVDQLSRGMKVKLQLAAALSMGASILILDEPTSGLDPVARDEVCELLREFVSDGVRSVLFSTHITSDLEKVADKIVFILNGKVICFESKETLLEQFVSVSGYTLNLSEKHKDMIIGYRESEANFEGMVKSSDIAGLPPTVKTNTAKLDEIVVYFNKEAKAHEKDS